MLASLTIFKTAILSIYWCLQCAFAVDCSRDDTYSRFVQLNIFYSTVI